MMGKKDGVLLATDGSSLSNAPAGWISSHTAHIGAAYVFGGTKSVTPRVKSQIDSRL